MAFAFAAADLLIEIDAEGRIAFAIGAAHTFFDEEEKALEGRPWRELIAPEDEPLVGALIESLDIGGRYGPVMIRLKSADAAAPRRVLFNACRLPQQPDRTACALSQLSAGALSLSRPMASGDLLDGNAFGDRAADLVAASKALDLRLALTFLELPGLTKLKGRLDRQAAAALMQRITGALRSGSLDGQSVGAMTDERFGFLHESGRETGAVATAIERLTRDADSAGQGIKPLSRTLDFVAGELGAEGIMRAVKYTIGRLTEDGVAGAIEGGLAGAFEELVNATIERIDAFGRMVRQEDFRLVFQPLVSLADGGLHHFEALSRFENGASPSEAIRFAEETGLVEDFDLAVLMRVAALLEAPDAEPRLAVAVNISGRSLQSDLFAGLLQRELAQHVALAGRLAVEVTESAEVKDLVRLDAILQRIRGRGFEVCLDDFGAGAASFQYLRALKVDWIKIDGLYVRRLVKGGRERAMVESLVELCRKLQVRTVAEQIEQADEAAILRDIGVDLGQGWHFGKPTDLPVYAPPGHTVAIGARPGPRARRMGYRETWG